MPVCFLCLCWSVQRGMTHFPPAPAVQDPHTAHSFSNQHQQYISPGSAPQYSPDHQFTYVVLCFSPRWDYSFTTNLCVLPCLLRSIGLPAVSDNSAFPARTGYHLPIGLSELLHILFVANSLLNSTCLQSRFWVQFSVLHNIGLVAALCSDGKTALLTCY